jgi:serine protease Do
MKLKNIFLILLLILTNKIFSQDWSSLFEENVKSVGLVSDSQTKIFASGFFISSRIFITNFHVADAIKPQSTKIKKKNEEVFTIKKIIGKYSKYDLAIIETNEKSAEYLSLENPDKIKVGEKVFAIGNPGTAFDVYKFNLSDGIINNIVDQDIQLEYFRVNALAILHGATINTGNSGGPLINENGAVVGINSYYITGKQNLNFAIHVKELIKILNENDLSYSKAGEDTSLLIFSILIGILVVICIVIIIIIIVQKNNKKKRPVSVVEQRQSYRQYTPVQNYPSRAYLVYSGQKYEITQGGISIGREETVILRILDETISRQHCRIYFENSNYYISDLGSKNGTFVNGKKILKEILRNADIIKVGKHSIQFIYS